MNSRVFKILVILLAGFGLVSGASRAHARPAGAEFTRVELGHTVSGWYPTDIDHDGRWELAITCAGSPNQIGVFSPQTGSWLVGPRPVSTSQWCWGAGDFDGDGLLEYAYVRSDTMRFYNPTTGTDRAAWDIPFSPEEAIFWGRDASGHPLVGLRQAFIRNDSDCGSPPMILCTEHSEKWIAHVYDLLTGVEEKQVPVGNSQWRLIADIPTWGDSRLIIHRHAFSNSTTDVDGMLLYGSSNLDSLMMVDSLWDYRGLVCFGQTSHVEGPPRGPLSLSSFTSIHCWIPPREMLFAQVSESGPWGSAQVACLNEGSHTITWSQSPANWPSHRSFAAYDLNSDGNPALYLPLESGAGWEVRALLTGAITDTLSGMPKADLQTGPLMTAGHQDLFYVADSGLYIWGLPTAVIDDEAPAAGVPTSPHITAFPNPFNSSVRLDWSSSSGASALEIFNILGQRVRTYDLSTASGSRSSIEWDGRDFAGHQVPSGLYFARLSGSQAPVVTKLVLLK